ncbi:MAG: leucyl aminopeptidase [Patescibacteria group bacterium]|nr:leucyl aminopeptidase [Patescibacteria group bacterium]
MKIIHTKEFSRQTAPVFVLRDKQKIELHPFFKTLSKEDQVNLRFLKSNAKQEGNESHVLLLSRGRRVLVISVPEGFNHRRALRTMRQVVTLARREKIGNLALYLDDFLVKESGILRESVAEMLATQIEIANFEFVKYKTKPKEGWFFVNAVQIISSGRSVKIKAALRRGKVVGEEINHTRILSNTPGGDMTPSKLADAARRAGRSAGFKVKVLDERAIRKLKMGGVLGVSRGSDERPRFIVMEYLKGRRSEKPVVLVGKGVTFDTGGLNLKPTEGIYEMHMDMSGGAAVIHTLAALAKLKSKRNIIGLVPAVENMPSGSSYRPGDVLRTMSGKTIEVLNTDAEGRVILADALEYAKRYKPRLVIDVATLTGSAVVALGQRASALFATDDRVSEKLRIAGEVTGDFVWPMPLWEEYEEDIKGTFGDVANTTTGKNRTGGVSTSAAFLWQFIKGHNWVHLDIAPRMTAIEGDYLAKGAAGAPVALLVQFLRGF